MNNCDICGEHVVDCQCFRKRSEVTLEDVLMYEANQKCVKEITIVLKGEDKTYKQKFLSYEPVKVSSDDPEIDRCIKEAEKNFVGDPEEIQVRILLQL